MTLSLQRLLASVFDPEAGERVVVACDLPRCEAEDSPAWADRRAWAEEWRQALVQLGQERGFVTLPLLTYPATGAHGAPLPAQGFLAGEAVELEPLLLQSTLAVFLTQYSATAALDGLTRVKADFRAASLPGVERRMLATALAADARELARRCQILRQAMDGAEELVVRFSTGHACLFDLRFRRPEVDDGYLPRGKAGDRVINLPSGETFIVPYEGEQQGVPSRTVGELPWQESGELVVFRVEANRIVGVRGQGSMSERFRRVFEEDPARGNVAEVAFGCNPNAVVTGNVLEDEKAGFHWAFGRSDHLGGRVGVAAFRSPHTVVHQDLVYAAGNPITVAEAVLRKPGGEVAVMRDGAYLLF